MKLTAAINAINAAVTRLGITATPVASHIQLIADVGYWILRVNPLDPVGVNDGTGALDEVFVQFFKTKTDDAVLADAIATDFYKSLREDAAMSDKQIMDFFKSLVDTSGVADHLAIDYVKPTLADAASFVDDSVYLLQKALVDAAGFSDSDVKDFFKALTDATALSDDSTNFVGKNLQDGSALADIERRDFSKVIVDQLFVTDDFDGAASILDDQNMQFQKATTDAMQIADIFYRMVAFVRAFTDAAVTTDQQTVDFSKALTDTPFFADDLLRYDSTKPLAHTAAVAELISKGVAKAPFSDAYGVSDVSTLQPGLVKTESTLLTDTGSLRSQGYCDFTYFAEDFVGASRTF